MFVKVTGDGNPLVLMHGGPGVDHTTMLPFLPLADHFKLVFYDHRCNGRSEGAAITSMTWENLTADAEALRQALGVDKWSVLGHSFGGMVALGVCASISAKPVASCAGGHLRGYPLGSKERAGDSGKTRLQSCDS